MKKVGTASNSQIKTVKETIGSSDAGSAVNFTAWKVGSEDVVTFAIRRAGGLRYAAVFPDGEPLTGGGLKTYDTPKEAIKALGIKDSTNVVTAHPVTINDRVNSQLPYGVDKLKKAGISREQALALLTYHGSLSNLRNVKDVKNLLRYKYLQDLFTELDAKKVLDYLSGVRKKERIAMFSDNKVQAVPVTIFDKDDSYFETFSAAVQYAREQAEKRGYQVDEDDWWNQVNTGPGRPKDGKTTKMTVGLIKNGKPQRQALQMSVYNRGTSRNAYELVYYIR